MSKPYTKLIRDKIPELIPSEKQRLVEKTRGSDYLADKLMEESAEIFEAVRSNDREQVLSELADLTEVRDQIAKQFGISPDEISKAQADKRTSRGGFELGYTLNQPFDEHNTRWFEGHDFTLLHFLQDLITRAKRIHLAVSFVMQSGLDLLENPFLEALANGCRIKLLTTNYLDVTDPAALRRLLAMGPNMQLKMYDGRGRSFHPKTWLFETWEERQVAVVGSSNLSRSALTSGVEWNYKVLDSDHGWPLQQAWQIFQHYFDAPESQDVSELLIRDYEHQRQPRTQVDLPISYPTIKPNPAQQEALVALSQMREAGEKRAMVVAATGLGKTYLAAFDSLPFGRVLFVAHREELLIQAERAFKTLRPQDSRQLLIRGQALDLSVQMVFASVQTLASVRNQNLLPVSHFDYVVVDEFHRAAAQSYQALFDLDCAFLLGLTATPFRLDNRDLLALCDSNIAYQINVIDAITAGWLCPFHYRGVYDATDYSRIERRSGQYSLKSLTRLLNNDTRNQLIFSEYLKSNSGQALGFCTTITHSQALAQFFSSHGAKSISLSSRSSREERATAISKLVNGEIRVIFTVDLFNEGVDIPSIDLVMFLRPTESVTVFLQQLGRGLRKHEGKTHLNVIDLVGNYKGADFKLPVMVGRQNWNQTDVRNICNQIIAGNFNQNLPGGIQIEFDTLAIESIKAVTRQGLAGLIVEEYQRVKTKLGHSPSLIEMLDHSRYPVKLYRQQFGSWMKFLKLEKELTKADLQLLGECGNFLEELEKTALTKSFKPVIILAMLEINGFEKSASLKNLATYFKQHFSQPRYKTDLIGTEIFKLDEVPETKIVRYIKRNPIAAWCNGKEPFFQLQEEDTFNYLGPKPSNPRLFNQWVKAIALYRIEEYSANRSRQGADHKIVWGTNANDKPLIHLDRSKAELPDDGQFHTVVIDGQKYLAKFMKNAINAVRPINSDENVLEQLLKKAHPARTREALSGWLVRITPIANDVGFEVEFR